MFGAGVKKKRLLVLGASLLQLPAIKKAQQMGFYVGVIDQNPKAVGMKIADEFFPVSTTDIPEVIKAAWKFCPQGILTLATDMPMQSVAAACKALGLPGISVEAAVRATEKDAMIRAFERARISHPWYQIVHGPKELHAKKKNLEYPCIVKPTDCSGSRGVCLVKSPDEIDETYHYCKNYSRKGKVIIEEYLVGREVSVEIMVEKEVPLVLQVTDKLTTGPPHFVEMGHSQPSGLSEKQVRDIKRLACEAVKAIGICMGPAHVEIMYTKTGPKIIELGARMGGDCIATHLVPLSTGVDMVEATIRSACGDPVNILAKCSMGSAIRYLSPKVGIVWSITGHNDALKTQGIMEVVLLLRKGSMVQPIKNSADRVGYVISQGSSSKAAVGMCEEAAEKIKIRTI